MSIPVIGQPIQYHSTKGAAEGAYITHPGQVLAVGDGGLATLAVTGPNGPYLVADAPEGDLEEPTPGTWNPLPIV